MAVKVYTNNRLTMLGRLPALPYLDHEQIEAANAMARDKSHLLISEPGAGKTLTAIEALLSVEDDYLGKRAKTIVLCPTIAIRTWASVLSVVYGLLDSDLVIQAITSGATPARSDADVLVATYGLISRGYSKIHKTLKDFGADVLICDESDNLANSKSQRTRYVFEELTKDIQWCWFLTGTPVPRYLDGLAPVLFAKFEDRLAQFGIHTKDEFMSTFCKTRLVKYNRFAKAKPQVWGNRNTEMMNDVLYKQPGAIATRNRLNIDRPTLKEITLSVALTKELKAAEAKLTSTPSIMDGPEGRFIEMDPTLTSAIRQFSCLLAHEVAKYVIDVLSGMRNRAVPDTSGILVLYWHRDVGDILLKAFNEAGFRARKIAGGTTQKDSASIVDEFCHGDLPILCGQIRAMGVALNLQERCHRVVFAEETASDTANLQAYQRVWRRGQTEHVVVDFCRTLYALSTFRPRIAGKKRADNTKILD